MEEEEEEEEETHLRREGVRCHLHCRKVHGRVFASVQGQFAGHEESSDGRVFQRTQHLEVVGVRHSARDHDSWSVL